MLCCYSGEAQKTKTGAAGTATVFKKDNYYAIKISHHFCADNREFRQLHLFIGGAQ